MNLNFTDRKLIWEEGEFNLLSFNFGGKNSYDDFGILISKRPSIPSPKRRISFIDIPGRDSTLRFDEGTFEDITIALECSVKDSSNITSKIDDIKAWLFTAGESDLIFSFQDDKKYIAQVVNQIDFKQVFKIFGEFIIIFNCRPFKYLVAKQVTTLLTSGIITNIGTIYSEPIIKVYGTGNGMLTVGTQVINLTGISGNIVIDSTIQDAYTADGSNLNNKMSGEFPILNVGNNPISWSGGITQVEITPNWRWL